MRTLGKILTAVALTLATCVVPTAPASAAALVEVTSFGDNPGGMRMHVYVPDTRPAKPAIVVAMHGCGGSGPGFYSGSEFASLADRLGFVVIYPSAQQEAGFGKCFDTWSDAAKRRGGGSDPVSIVSMVNHVQQRYGGDPDRVFATGSSSGGMMTNEMLALYPDVFKAGAAFMGVPFGCFANAADYPPGSSRCTGGGGANRTPQEWGTLVRQAYPGYTGLRPRMQLWHGTADTLVPYSLLREEVEQWTNVFGLSQTPTSTDTPRAGWNRSRYSTQVESISVQGAGHSLPSAGMAAAALEFFGLTGGGGPDPVPGACGVKATVNAWNNGLTASLSITNTGTAAITGWSLAFTLASGQTITSGWNATYSPSAGQVTARNAGHNATIPPGRSVDIGFQASHNGNTAVPTSFALNGSTCTTG
ncbi:PHB depolymerase family esterase [Lentzea sp. NPDC060358]|uniref:extracellular catalytic domain type 1 short-chain-length polyhydroxyalkanoate depolymerase n=1 Tax=Lentzea sp. NPDC060358 TaxID=3347103 RepID=UPI003654E96C